MNGSQLFTKTIHVDWAFSRGPIQNFKSTRYGVSDANVLFSFSPLTHWCKLSFSFGYVSALHWPASCLISTTKILIPIVPRHDILASNSGTRFLLVLLLQLFLKLLTLEVQFGIIHLNGCLGRRTDHFLMFVTGHHAQDLGLLRAGLLPWRHIDYWGGAVARLCQF